MIIETTLKDMVESNTIDCLTDAGKSMFVHKQNDGCNSYILSAL